VSTIQRGGCHIDTAALIVTEPTAAHVRHNTMILRAGGNPGSGVSAAPPLIRRLGKSPQSSHHRFSLRDGRRVRTSGDRELSFDIAKDDVLAAMYWELMNPS
jgi:hypothetical protein